MRKNVTETILFLCFLSFISIRIQAQNLGKGLPPHTEYQELTAPAAIDKAEWEKQPDGLCFAWGSTDVRYNKVNVPQNILHDRTLKLSSWKGEKLNAQCLLWSKQTHEKISLKFCNLKDNRGNSIPAECLSAGFVRYVMTDELNKERTSGCGHRPDKTQWDSLLVADPIDITPFFALNPQNVCPVWVSIRVPRDIPTGTYNGKIVILDNEKETGSLRIQVKVGKNTLPPPSEWRFHLDLWQNPYSVARYYNTEEWTDEHFEAMRPIMKALAEAGQKVITASITHKPWNGQTYDYFKSMITWIRKYDGSWEFRFDVFDAWVEFMISLGIDRQINCYSMVPWNFTFQYFDQKSNQMQTIHTEPGEKEYTEIWTALLKSFAKHLKEKGWFEKTCIAMDERPMEVMQKTIELIRSVDKNFKVALAGLYYEEIEPYIFDYCVSTDQLFPFRAIERRKTEKKVTTYYTYCGDTRPNTFTFSAPADAAWIGFYAARLHMDGYLRWAYNSWVENPLQDSRFVTWAGGDTYLVYPGFRSSIRFERLIEGIQQNEKITLLRNHYLKENNKKKLAELEKKLQMFDLEELKKGAKAEDAVRTMTEYLNK